MKTLNFLNPQKWIGQIAVLGFFFLAGNIAGGYVDRKYFPCPPTTQVNVDQKVKAKKNSQVQSALGIGCDCSEVIKSMSLKEFKKKKKEY